MLRIVQDSNVEKKIPHCDDLRTWKMLESTKCKSLRKYILVVRMKVNNLRFSKYILQGKLLCLRDKQEYVCEFVMSKMWTNYDWGKSEKSEKM